MKRALADCLRRIAERVSPAPALPERRPVIVRAVAFEALPEPEPSLTSRALEAALAGGVRAAADSLRIRAEITRRQPFGRNRAAVLLIVADELDADARKIAREASMGDA